MPRTAVIDLSLPESGLYLVIDGKLIDREKINEFDKEIEVQIAKAKLLVCCFREGIEADALLSLERDIRNAFRRAAGIAPASYSRELRISHFAGRKKWASAKKEDKNLTPLDHIRTVYADRKEFKLCRSDLKDDRLDPKLYRALADWLRPKEDGSKNVIPSDFGLPKKSQITEQVIEDNSYIEVEGVIPRLDENAASLVRAYKALSTRSVRKSKLYRNSLRLAAE